jgi:hypothetical protein
MNPTQRLCKLVVRLAAVPKAAERVLHFACRAAVLAWMLAV